MGLFPQGVHREGKSDREVMQGGRSGGGLPYEDLTRNSPKEAAVVGQA